MGNKFKQWSDSDVVDLVREYPLALVISCSGPAFMVTPLPLLPVTDDAGRLTQLVGHMALHNQHVETLRRQPRVQIIFQGPNGYISPNLLQERNWAPTWNYAFACMECDIHFTPDFNATALNDLVSTMEKGHAAPWSVAELGERYDALAQRIISFKADVREIDATFKLGQDERPRDFGQIIDGLESESLEAWMKRFYPKRG